MFVGLALAGDGRAVKVVVAECRGFFGAKAALPGRQAWSDAIDLAYQGLDFAIGIPAGGFFFEDEVGAHTAPSEGFDTIVIVGAEGMGIEVFVAAVAHILEEFDQHESAFDVGCAKAEVLVIAPHDLVIEVDMEELAHFPGLGDAMQKVQPGHRFVGNFGIDADHFGVVEGVDEGQGMPDGGQKDVASGFVGLGFDGELEVVVL